MIMNFQVTEYTYFITTSNYDFNFIALKGWIVTLAAYFNTFFCSTLSEFENFLLCERILINVTTCQNETSS
jgi:hypothetical protein